MTPLAWVIIVGASLVLVTLAGVRLWRAAYDRGHLDGFRSWPNTNEAAILEAVEILERSGLDEARRYVDTHPLDLRIRRDVDARLEHAMRRPGPLIPSSALEAAFTPRGPVTEPTPMPVDLAPPAPGATVVLSGAGAGRYHRLERVVVAVRADPAFASCYSPDVDPNSTGGGDIREVPCGACPACRLADAIDDLRTFEASE